MSEFDPTKRTTEYGNMDRAELRRRGVLRGRGPLRNFITFDNMKNGWVRNATALHFVNSMVGTQRGSKWITVQDCVSREPISQRRGRRGGSRSRCAANSRSCSVASPTRDATRS